MRPNRSLAAAFDLFGEKTPGQLTNQLWQINYTRQLAAAAFCSRVERRVCLCMFGACVNFSWRPAAPGTSSPNSQLGKHFDSNPNNTKRLLGTPTPCALDVNYFSISLKLPACATNCWAPLKCVFALGVFGWRIPIKVSWANNQSASMEIDSVESLACPEILWIKSQFKTLDKLRSFATQLINKVLIPSLVQNLVKTVSYSYFCGMSFEKLPKQDPNWHFQSAAYTLKEFHLNGKFI